MNDDDNDFRFVEIEGEIVGETAAAIRIRVGLDGFWLPKSKVGRITYPRGDSREVRRGESFEAIEMSWWLAGVKGLR